MNPDLKILIELQDADRRIAEIETEKEKLPTAVDALRREVMSSLAEYEGYTREIEALEARQLEISRGLEEEKARLEHSQERLPNITTQKAYYALLKEVESCERTLESLGQERARLTEEIASIRAERDKLEAGLRSEEETFEEQKVQMEADFSHLDEELRGLLVKRNEVCAAMKPTVLSRYKRIASRRSPMVVVSARDGRCSGCNIKLPPQIYADVKRNDRINLCSHCNRILYYSGEEE